MPVITQSRSTRSVVINKPVPVRTIEQQLEAVEVPTPGAAPVVVDNAAQRIVETGKQGPRGPAGPPGPAGQIEGTTDELDEGDANLYFTPERAAAAAPVQSVNGLAGDVVLGPEDVQADPEGTAIAAASAAVSSHQADPDPHTQYRKKADVLDGGNF